MRQHRTSDAQLRIGGSRGSGFDALHGSGTHGSGTTVQNNNSENTAMTGPETLDVARDAIWTIVLVSSPLMVVGLVVGVVVSLFQALTQIQEQTLVFVPKILAIFVTLLLALPFMADALSSHMMRISSRIIGG
jgi:flagellar biosynthesis protein FliQ